MYTMYFSHMKINPKDLLQWHADDWHHCHLSMCICCNSYPLCPAGPALFESGREASVWCVWVTAGASSVPVDSWMYWSPCVASLQSAEMCTHTQSDSDIWAEWEGRQPPLPSNVHMNARGGQCLVKMNRSGEEVGKRSHKTITQLPIEM